LPRGQLATKRPAFSFYDSGRSKKRRHLKAMGPIAPADSPYIEAVFVVGRASVHPLPRSGQDHPVGPVVFKGA
jgi:hypothetical protein